MYLSFTNPFNVTFWNNKSLNRKMPIIPIIPVFRLISAKGVNLTISGIKIRA